MLINLSNHHSDLWKEKQKKTAIKQFGSIVNIAHPVINPGWNYRTVQKKTEVYFNKIMIIKTKSKSDDCVVHLMGESTFTYQLLNMLRKNKIKAVASTTKRIVDVDEKGSKISRFEFVKYRQYYI